MDRIASPWLELRHDRDRNQKVWKRTGGRREKFFCDNFWTHFHAKPPPAGARMRIVFSTKPMTDAISSRFVLYSHGWAIDIPFDEDGKPVECPEDEDGLEFFFDAEQLLYQISPVKRPDWREWSDDSDAVTFYWRMEFQRRA